MVVPGERAKVTVGEDTGVHVGDSGGAAGKEGCPWGSQGGRRGVCGSADTECGVSVGLSMGNRGSVGLSVWKQGSPRGCWCGRRGVYGGA